MGIENGVRFGKIGGTPLTNKYVFCVKIVLLNLHLHNG